MAVDQPEPSPSMASTPNNNGPDPSATPNRPTADEAETDRQHVDVHDDESISHQNISLMRRIRAQDETALEELYDRYAGSVYAVARHILRHSADAEEVVMDTFWEVWRKADRYDPSRGSVISYILLLARSRAIDRSRQVRSREIAHGQLQSLELQSALSEGVKKENPELNSELAERRSYIRRLLAELPAERREAIELSFLKGLSHRQIATALNVPLGTIKTRIRQGLIQLYEQLRTTERGSSS